MEEESEFDEDVRLVMDGTDGDPDKIRENIKRELSDREWITAREGSDTPPKIVFREVNALGFWVWIEFLRTPLEREKELLESILKSWFTVGKLGGYNSQNLQVFYNADDDQSYFDYDTDSLGDTMASFLHEMSEVEFRGSWARFRLDMGTGDELCLDVLLNMLVGFSADMAGLKTVYMGGSNDDWPAPAEEDLLDNEPPKVSIDPMRLPQGLDEEMELLGDLDDLGLTTAAALGRQPGFGGDLAARAAAAGRQGSKGRGGSSESKDDDNGIGGANSAEKLPPRPWGASFRRKR